MFFFHHADGSVPTCAMILGLGQSVTAITAEELENMHLEEFEDCLYNLGLIKGWSDEQTDTLFAHFKVVGVHPRVKWI